MGKVIKPTEQDIQKLREEFEEALQKNRFADGKFSFSSTLSGYAERKAKVIFSEVAWLKMNSLISEFSSEVAWNGIVFRGENPDEYYVSDIIIYPQSVTGVTVERDTDKFAEWCCSIPNEMWCNIRMHGHSHVNMGTSPSATDKDFYEKEILPAIGEDGFYILSIWNKSGSKTVIIYDLANNIMFENNDVEVVVRNEGIGIEDFLREAHDMVQSKTYQTQKPVATTPAASASNTSSKKPVSLASYYGGYYSSSYYDDDYDDYDYNGYGKYTRKGWVE